VPSAAIADVQLQIGDAPFGADEGGGNVQICKWILNPGSMRNLS
jgi:hypothetical protein